VNGGIENLTQIGVAFSHALFDGLWVGAAVAIAVSLVLRSLPRLNAATRHAAWYAALVVIAVMPIVGFAVSLAKIQITPTTSAPQAIQISAAHATTTGFDVQQFPVQPSTDKAATVSPAFSSDVVRQGAIVLAFAIAAIAFARFGVLVFGLFGLAREKRASRIVDPAVVPTVARTMARDTGARRVDVRISESLDSPAAAGFRTPAILLPEHLIESLDPAALDQVAMHEYAHLRRYDDWTNLGQRIVERLYWFNPAVWFVTGRIDLEREIACDDWAVAGGTGVSSYADCLLHLAREGRLPAFAATAPGAFMTRHQVVARIEHLLARHRDGEPFWRPGKLVAIAPVLAAALALAVGRAPAIALHLDPVRSAAPSVANAAFEAPTIALRPSGQVSVLLVPLPAPSCTPTPGAQAESSTLSPALTRTIERTVDRTVRTLVVSHVGYVHHVETHVDLHKAVELTVSVSNAALAHAAIEKVPAIVATAAVTDNISAGPDDRNILAHCTGCDLSGQDLRNADLHALNLTGDDLSGADLRGANLRGTSLTGVDLSDAKLDRADLRGAVLTGSDIDGASFAGAKTEGIRLVGMQLTDAILAAASARALLSSCAGCDLSGLNLRGRDLHGITLDGADLHDADLSGANLAGARFNGVDLQGAKFDGADLTNASMNGCDLQDVDLSSAHTDGLSLQGSALGASATPCPKATHPSH
jgi:uncharacterized protein YjbI with pentapeptide repeats/beta-lactamase regulating signal transducer with metallopeptidase domain